MPPRGWIGLDLADIWRYRDLLYFLVWRDLKVRYKQTVLGAMWAILQPVLTMVLFSVVFGALAHLPSDGIPYPIFTFTALLPWQLFAYSLSQSSNSLVDNQNLVKRIYFPRVIIPLSSVFAGLADFAIAFSVLVCMMLIYGIQPSIRLLSIPLFVLFAMGTAVGVGLWLSALNVKYRDVRYTIPFLTQFWMYASPIAYSSSLVPERWHLLYGLNPMAGVVEGFRWALLGRSGAVPSLIWASVSVVALMLVGGLVYFRFTEDEFADIL